MKKSLKIALTSALLLLGINVYSVYANQDNQSLIEEQKQKIISLAEKYRGDDSPEGRALLETEVETLLSMTEKLPIEERIKRLPRAWEQIYGPISYGRIINIPLDPNRIYQVVMKEGYYYNIGYSQFLGGTITTTGLLKGEYAIQDDGIQIKFVKNTVSLKEIPSDVHLKSLVRLAENKNLTTIQIPLSSRARQPGFLSEEYIDNTLRITHGGNLNNPREYLYVLQAIRLTK